MSNQNVAEQRRAAEVKQLRNKVESINRDISAGVHNAQGQLDGYLVKRSEWLEAERDRLEAEIRQLGKLDADQLVDRYVPEAKPADPIALSDVLTGRGAMLPGERVINLDQPKPARHEGGHAYPVMPEMGPEGWVPGQTYTYS